MKEKDKARRGKRQALWGRLQWRLRVKGCRWRGGIARMKQSDAGEDDEVQARGRCFMAFSSSLHFLTEAGVRFKGKREEEEEEEEDCGFVC